MNLRKESLDRVRLGISTILLILTSVSAGLSYCPWNAALNSIRYGRRPALNINLLGDLPDGNLSRPLLDGSTSWLPSVESAAAEWNTAGADFLYVKPPAYQRADACNFNDGLNTLSWRQTNCDGMGFGDFLAVASPRATEFGIAFNLGVPWNSYRGALRNSSLGSWLYDIRRVALHELGHAAGLDHTQKCGQAIKSIMSQNDYHTVEYLTADDKAGVVAIWGTAAPPPLPPPPPSTATLNVVEYYSASLDHYFITASPAEQAYLDSGGVPGFRRTGEQFKALQLGSSGTAGVCRFYSSLYNSHFYTANSEECTWVRNTLRDWAFERTEFGIRLPNGQSCPTGVPVYRAFNNRPGSYNHRFTTSLTTYQRMVGSGWRGESVVMCAER